MSLSYVAVSQVASRGVTFLLNLIVTRLLSPEAYGVRSAVLPCIGAEHAVTDVACTDAMLHLDLYVASAAGRCAVSPDQHHHPVPQPRGLPPRLPAHASGESLLALSYSILWVDVHSLHPSCQAVGQHLTASYCRMVRANWRLHDERLPMQPSASQSAAW